jgi:purine-binding chemotaxis protein CheW
MSELISLLVVVGGTLRVGLPIEQVGETMRPLPIQSLGYPLPFVQGLSTIRGLSIPVIDLGLLLSPREQPGNFRRFVTIHVEDRLAALAVEEVEGIVTMNQASFSRLPPLLSEAAGDSVDGLSLADSKLFLALKPSRLVPDPWVDTQADAP